MTSPADLLRALGVMGPARATPKTEPPAPTGAADTDFASLLKKARSGEIGSGIPVSIDRDAGVELTPEELNSLAVAADRAEAAGIRTALVMMDGKALVLDVHTRTVMKQADLSAGPVTGIDGVIRLSSARPEDAQVLPPPSYSTSNGNLWSALQHRAA